MAKSIMETATPMDSGAGRSLLCRVDSRLCALQLEHVVEMTRPMPIQRVVGAPDFVLGVAILRGSVVPVVDAGRLLGGTSSSPTRFVVFRAGERRVALAVEGVLGIRRLARGALEELPPLLRSADTAAVEAIGALDAALLVVLQALRIVPEELLAAIEVEAVAS